jgi:2-polyprenyl-3-methyl-5-hydroxy-6-metoxy-1,4-benzoquinol methylase
MGWSEIWKGFDDARFRGETYRWFFYMKLLGDYDLKGKKVLEIGCGTGINSVLMARAGAHVTLLDSSKEALGIAKRLLDSFSLKGKLVYRDAFYHGFEGEFDLVHSEGVIEHFKGRYRQDIMDSHSRAAKMGGMVLIIVPNMKCPPYRIGKFLAEKTGTWIYGNEYPYSSKELDFRMRKSGLEVEMMSGAEIAFSPGWLFSPIWQRSSWFVRKSVSSKARMGVVRLNYGGSFLNEWGPVIGAVGRRA